MRKGGRAAFEPAAAAAALEGATVGVISNGKEGTGPFFAAPRAGMLKERHGVGRGGVAHEVELQRAGRGRTSGGRGQGMGRARRRHRRLRQLLVVQFA